MEKLVLRVSEAASALATGEDEVRHLLRSGELASYRTPGGHWRIPTRALEAFIERRVSEEAASRADRRPSWPLRGEAA